VAVVKYNGLVSLSSSIDDKTTAEYAGE